MPPMTQYTCSTKVNGMTTIQMQASAMASARMIKSLGLERNFISKGKATIIAMFPIPPMGIIKEYTTIVAYTGMGGPCGGPPQDELAPGGPEPSDMLVELKSGSPELCQKAEFQNPFVVSSEMYLFLYNNYTLFIPHNAAIILSAANFNQNHFRVLYVQLCKQLLHQCNALNFYFKVIGADSHTIHSEKCTTNPGLQ